MISQIIYNIYPVQYKTTVAMIKRELNQGIEVTLDSVKDDLRQIYGSIKPTKRISIVSGSFMFIIFITPTVSSFMSNLATKAT